MKLGIDFGTSRTSAAFDDNGNYPLISFGNVQGDFIDNYPSLIAVNQGEARYGFEAQKLAQEPGWTLIRSLKSLLKNIRHGSSLSIDGHDYPIQELLAGYLAAFRVALIKKSNIAPLKTKLQVAIAVPANTNNAQRFITTECFKAAGFEVLRMINEPSAAAMEYTKSYFKRVDLCHKHHVLVYDLGAGTFDASVAEIQNSEHRIIATEGITDLGGDQFDEILADMVIQELKLAPKLDIGERASLLEICREQKEKLTPQSKNILLEWGSQESEAKVVKIKVNDYFEQCAPLVDQTVQVLNRILDRMGGPKSLDDFSAIYLVGGMSNFPLINRHLKKLFGNAKIKKSQHCQDSVSIGLTALLDTEFDDGLCESLTHYFGLWREEQQGQHPSFDTIFVKDHLLPKKGQNPVISTRRYHPTHNVGVFRFLECSSMDKGKPDGLITLSNRVTFPFDPRLAGKNLEKVKVTRYAQPVDFEIEEVYRLNGNGEVSLEVINHQNGFHQSYPLARLNP